jgi:hypothetical protein
MPDVYPLVEQLADRYTVETEAAERFNRYRFTLLQAGNKLGRGTHFLGGNHIKPWIELQPAIVLEPGDSSHRELFSSITGLLDPGSHVMVHYLQDTATAESLTADVPPPVTPLGFLLWQAGVRWYKDWYFTEGWMEGDQKLQGNLPVDEANKAEREDEWRDALQQFVAEDTEYSNCQKRAEQLLETL